MPSQRLKTVIVVAAIAVLAFWLWRCTRDSTSPASHPQAGHGAAPATNAAAAPDASADAAARQARARAEHDAALTAAVSALHRYFAVLFNADRSEADGLWIDARPATSGEADLRSLDDVRSLRTENGTPRTLDTASPPDAVEIPVRLRIAAGNAPIREYTGHYRLRRGHAGAWRITSASIDASPQRR